MLCKMEYLNFFSFKFFQILGTNSLFIYLFHQNIGYMIIDRFDNYWIGALTATFNAIVIGILFNNLYDWITQRIRRNK